MSASPFKLPRVQFHSRHSHDRLKLYPYHHSASYTLEWEAASDAARANS